MSLETVVYVNDLNASNPTATDPKSEGDDHLRNIKTALLNTFPGATGPTSFTNLVSKTGTTGTAGLPSGTTAQRSTSLGIGIRYNTDLSSFEGYNGSAWGSIGGGATGAGADTVFQLNSTVMTGSYTLPTGKNAMLVGPLTVNSGVTLSVPSGARLVIL